jgi:hypothetical protein
MESDDWENFSKAMVSCFQNFRAAISKELMSEWFDELKEFDLLDIRSAFKMYVRETESFPPTLATIIRLANKSAEQRYAKIINEQPKRCCVENCNAKNVDAHWYCPQTLICRLHMEEAILSTSPNSVEAKIIKEAREFEHQIKLRGETAEEHFAKSNPEWFAKIRNSFN